MKQPACEEPAHHDGGDRRERSRHEDPHTCQLSVEGKPHLREPTPEAIFRARVHRLWFHTSETLHFRANLAGNVLRGALGTVLEEEVFRPRLESGPSGFANPPRPFVLRAAHLNARTFLRDERFHLDVNTFDRRGEVAVAVVAAFARFSNGPFHLTGAAALGAASIDLAQREPASRVRVRFISPIELKGASATGPVAFPVLFARIRDRVSALCSLYGDCPLRFDFRGMGERAQTVRTVGCDVRYHHAPRRSANSGATHGIGGFTGTAEYAGDLAEFAPWLRAARWTGAGRHTVWGNGEIECEFEI